MTRLPRKRVVRILISYDYGEDVTPLTTRMVRVTRFPWLRALWEVARDYRDAQAGFDAIKVAVEEVKP